MKDDKDKREVRLRLIIPDTASRLELPLTQSKHRPRYDRLMQAMDYLNRTEKPGAVHVAGHDEKLFPMHHEHLSHSFTTCWDGILKVECGK